jgi:FixJ family two-component response regulator
MEVIFISGSASAFRDRRLGRRDRFIEKPFAPAVLADFIRAAAQAAASKGASPDRGVI